MKSCDKISLNINTLLGSLRAERAAQLGDEFLVQARPLSLFDVVDDAVHIEVDHLVFHPHLATSSIAERSG